MVNASRYVRLITMTALAAAVSMEAAAQTYSQRFARDQKPFRPTNVRSDVDSDVYTPSTTRGGFNAYQGRRGNRNRQSRFFDIRREVVRPPTAAERNRAAKERFADRINYDYGTRKYPSDHYDDVRLEAYEAPETSSSAPRYRPTIDDEDSRLRLVTRVNRTRPVPLSTDVVKELNHEQAALDRSLAQSTIVEFRAVDGETVLTNEPEKYRNDPTYYEVENHSTEAARSTQPE